MEIIKNSAITTAEIEIMESVFAKNREAASKFNERLTRDGVFAVNVLGSPGAGKTSALIQIAEIIERFNKLENKTNDVWVIEGDVQSDIDTVKLTELGIKTAQINTNGVCHLDVPFVEEAYNRLANAPQNTKENGKKSKKLNGFLFIENIGNLICPAEFEVGEHINMLITCVADGSDKPYKYPAAFEKADLILINKYDLADYVDFDYDFYYKGVKILNPRVPVFKVSAKNGEGFNEVVQWLTFVKKSPLRG